MALFEIDELKPQVNDDHLFFDEDDHEFVICKSPEKLSRLINALEAHKSVHFVSDGDWSMHDLVMQLLKKYRPAELFVTTYALRELAVRQMIMAMDRKELISVNMVLDYRAHIRTPEVYQLATINLNKICLTNVHAKVTVLRTASECITIVGSANWTNNPKIECGLITMNRAAADFHISWIQKVMDNAEIFK